MNPTNEQQNIITAAIAGKNLSIQAGAGAGKSSTLRMVANALPKKNILYLVFNKDNAEEAERTFPANVTCKTINSLAYGKIIKYPKSAFGKRLSSLALEDIHVPEDIEETSHNSYRYIIRNVITEFCNSAERDIREFTRNYLEAQIHVVGKMLDKLIIPEPLLEALTNTAQDYWVELCSENSATQISHSVYMKLYQLSEPLLVEYDIIMVDEFQDTNEVCLDIILRQPSQVIVVGDPNQSIYGFRGAVNGFEKIPESFTQLKLTESFRFTKEIAEIARKALLLKDENFPLVGLAKDMTPINPSRAVVCRTNVKIIEYIVDAIQTGKKVYTNVDTREIGKYLYHIESCNNSKPVKFPVRELNHITDYNSLVKFAQLDTNVSSLWGIVKFLRKKGGVYGFMSKLNSVLVKKDQAEFSVITCHRSKGLEFDEVILADDFGPRWDKDEGCYQYDEWHSRLEDDEQEVNLLYIGVTRARYRVSLPQSLYGIL